MRKAKFNQYTLFVLKQKIKRDRTICNRSLMNKSTWQHFEQNREGKTVVLYGCGNFMYHLCALHKEQLHASYAVDQARTVSAQSPSTGLTFYPTEQLFQEPDKNNVIVLITPVDHIDEIADTLEQHGITEYYSLAAMEYNIPGMKFRVALANIFKSYMLKWHLDYLHEGLSARKKNEHELQQRVGILERRTEYLMKQNAALWKNNSQLWDYLRHTNMVLNALIDESGNLGLMEEQIQYKFREIWGNEYTPNLRNPQTFNEKILSATLYDRQPIYTRITNKITFKDYIAEQLGSEYVVPLLGVWKHPDEIDWDALPERFVLKSPRGGDSTDVIVVKDKSTADLDAIRTQMIRWIAPYRNLYYANFNWGFRDIEPVIMAEEFIGDPNAPYTYEYKFFVFHGKVEFFYVSTVEFKDGNPDIKVTYLNKDFTPIQVIRNHANVDEIHRSPFHDQMYALSEQLGAPFDFVRVDFMETDDRFYIAELTFTPSGGMAPISPVELDYEWGKLW